MEKINISDNNQFVNTFLTEYLADGMGAFSKREIDILIMSLLMKFGGLDLKSNHDLSILLQTTESRIKGLKYEALLKYPPDADYVKQKFLVVLGKSQFEIDKKNENDLEKMKIIFIIEDDYLRHAIQGRLKAKGMFADTSFNCEIVKIEFGFLVSVINELFDKETANRFIKEFNTLRQEKGSKGVDKYKDQMIKFVLDTAKSILSGVGVAVIKSQLGF